MVEASKQGKHTTSGVTPMTARILWSRIRRSHNESDESGQGLAEYALILAFVALACVGALGLLGTAISGSPGFSLFDLV